MLVWFMAPITIRFHVDAEFVLIFQLKLPHITPITHSSLIFHVVVGGLGFFLGLLVSSSVKTKSVGGNVETVYILVLIREKN